MDYDTPAKHGDLRDSKERYVIQVASLKGHTFYITDTEQTGRHSNTLVGGATSSRLPAVRGAGR